MGPMVAKKANVRYNVPYALRRLVFCFCPRPVEKRENQEKDG